MRDPSACSVPIRMVVTEQILHLQDVGEGRLRPWGGRRYARERGNATAVHQRRTSQVQLDQGLCALVGLRIAPGLRFFGPCIGRQYPNATRPCIERNYEPTASTHFLHFAHFSRFWPGTTRLTLVDFQARQCFDSPLC